MLLTCNCYLVMPFVDCISCLIDNSRFLASESFVFSNTIYDLVVPADTNFIINRDLMSK